MSPTLDTFGTGFEVLFASTHGETLCVLLEAAANQEGVTLLLAPTSTVIKDPTAR